MVRVLFFDRSEEQNLLKSRDWFGSAHGGSHVKHAPHEAGYSSGEVEGVKKEDRRSFRDSVLGLLKKVYSSSPKTAQTKNGDKIIIAWSGIRHGLNKGIPTWQESVAALHLPYLISRSDKESVHPDKLGRQDPESTTIYGSSAKFDGVEYAVKIYVRNHSDGNRYYDHVVLEGKTPVGLTGSGSGGSHLSSPTLPFAGADSTIPKELKKSSEPMILFLKATTTKTVTIPAFTDKNGRFVPTHVKSVHFDPNKSVADVVSGNGSHSQKKAHAKLHKYPGFKDLHEMDKYHHILSSGTNIQKKKSLAGAISVWKDTMLAGKKPTPAVQAAFDSLPESKKAELLALVGAGNAKPEPAPAVAPEPVPDSGVIAEPVVPEVIAPVIDYEAAVATAKLAEIAAGHGGHYPGIAYKKLVGSPAFEAAHPVARLEMVVKLAKELQRIAIATFLDVESARMGEMELRPTNAARGINKSQPRVLFFVK